MSDLEYTTIPLDLIDPHPDNPRQHPDEQIAGLEASYKELGQFRSFVIWKRPNGRYLQVTSHGITEAMRREGATHCRVEILPEDTDPMRVKRIMLADNLHAQKAQDDEALLVRLLQEQQDAGIDLETLGSSDEDLRQMLEQLGDVYLGSDKEEDEASDELPEEVGARARRGDVWQLGRHKIACLDSCNPEQIRGFVGGVAVSFVWADPPYGISIVKKDGHIGGGGNGKIIQSDKLGGLQGKWAPQNNTYAQVIGDDSKFTAHTSFHIYNALFPKALQIWWGANHYSDRLPSSSGWIVWDKENDGTAFADAELAWSNHKGAVRIFRHTWNGMRRASEQGVKRVHPNQKPILRAKWAFDKYGKENDIIFDPFLGSGISVIAAERMGDGRTVYGCELSPEYIDIVIERWEKEIGEEAKLIKRMEIANVE